MTPVFLGKTVPEIKLSLPVTITAGAVCDRRGRTCTKLWLLVEELISHVPSVRTCKYVSEAKVSGIEKVPSVEVTMSVNFLHGC